MELQDLVGKHWLTGVDFSNKSIETYSNNFEDCQCINFVLDNVTYTAVEDPYDGYRSTMREIGVSDYEVKNIFQACEVMGSMRDNGTYDNDILDLTDTATGKVVLSVGTGDAGDYYPYWVAEFTPENMLVNQK